MIYLDQRIHALSTDDRNAASGIDVRRELPCESWRCPGCHGRFTDSAGYAAHLLADAKQPERCIHAKHKTVIVCGHEVVGRALWIESKELGGGKTGRQRTIYGVSPAGAVVVLKRCRDMKEVKCILERARCQALNKK